MKYFLALLAGAAVAALPVAASSADAAPPTPCTGTVLTDPAKDEELGYLPISGLPVNRVGEDPNLDVRALFFTYRKNDADKMVLTAHIQVTNLTKNVPPEAGPEEDIHWYAEFNLANDVTWLRATTDGTNVRYEYGKRTAVVPGQLFRTVATATTGAFHEGPDGVVSIDWPAEVPIAAGTKLEGVFAQATTTGDTVESTGLAFFADIGPDEGTKTYTVTECPAETPGGEQTTTTTTQPDQGQQQPPSQQPQPQPQPAPAPAPSPQGQPAPGSPLPATGTLSFDVAVDKGKRKTAVRRGLRGRVRCSVQCKVTATAKIDKRTARKLKLGRKAMTIGKGRASIKKAGRIPFYVKMTKKAKRALKRKGVKRFALKVSFRVTDNQGKQVKKVTRKSTLR